MRLLRMIKNPQRPAVGRMAALAFLAEAALVHVIVRMALHAYRRRPAVGQRRVALRAADDAVQSEQREFRQVMIECHVGPPRNLAMTGFAPAVDLAAMRVFAAMAAHAVLGEFLRVHRCGMADVAVNLGVRALQREFGFRGVIIGHGLPPVVVMAVLALDAEAEGVSIISLVAAVAVLRDLVLV